MLTVPNVERRWLEALRPRGRSGHRDESHKWGPLPSKSNTWLAAKCSQAGSAERELRGAGFSGKPSDFFRARDGSRA
jgi:hypothetical protein